MTVMAKFTVIYYFIVGKMDRAFTLMSHINNYAFASTSWIVPTDRLIKLHMFSGLFLSYHWSR